MTDLEMIFKAEKEKHDINKTTAEDLNKKYFKERGKMMSDLDFYLSFLGKYGIEVKFKSGYDVIYLSKESYNTAHIATKTEYKRIGEEYFYSLVPNTYIVDWTYNSCHKNEMQYTDIKELVKAIAEKFR